MIVSVLSAALVLVVAVLLVVGAWSRVPWSASEPVRLRLPFGHRRGPESDDRYELAVRRGRLVNAAFDGRLRPLLHDVARVRLRRRGVDLRAEPAAAVALLGTDLSQEIGLLPRPAPDAARRAMSPAELDAHLRRLEAL